MKMTSKALRLVVFGLFRGQFKLASNTGQRPYYSAGGRGGTGFCCGCSGMAEALPQTLHQQTFRTVRPDS